MTQTRGSHYGAKDALFYKTAALSKNARGIDMKFSVRNEFFKYSAHLPLCNNNDKSFNTDEKNVSISLTRFQNKAQNLQVPSIMDPHGFVLLPGALDGRFAQIFRSFLTTFDQDCHKNTVSVFSSQFFLEVRKCPSKIPFLYCLKTSKRTN